MLFLWITLFSFLINKLGTYLTIQIAKDQAIFEATDHRKLHTEKVSALGGLPIFITILISTTIVISTFSKVLPIIAAAFILVGVGLWDDLKNIGVKRRLLVQLIVANIAYFSGFNFGLEETLVHSLVDYTMTIGFIGLLINGMNFIDGINGLAGGLGAIATAIFSIIFYTNGHLDLALLAAIYVGALLGFLSYNFGKKATIFMGDNGSTVIGFLLAIFALKVWNFSGELADSSFLSNIALGLVALPFLDLFGVVITRLINHQSPFKADRNHIHHLVTDSGNTHPKTCLIILGWVIGLVALFYFEIIISIPFACLVIVMTYLLLRAAYIAPKSPRISPAKWNKPVPQSSSLA